MDVYQYIVQGWKSHAVNMQRLFIRKGWLPNVILVVIHIYNTKQLRQVDSTVATIHATSLKSMLVFWKENISSLFLMVKTHDLCFDYFQMVDYNGPGKDWTLKRLEVFLTVSKYYLRAEFYLSRAHQICC